MVHHTRVVLGSLSLTIIDWHLNSYLNAGYSSGRSGYLEHVFLWWSWYSFTHAHLIEAWVLVDGGSSRRMRLLTSSWEATISWGSYGILCSTKSISSKIWYWVSDRRGDVKSVRRFCFHHSGRWWICDHLLNSMIRVLWTPQYHPRCWSGLKSPLAFRPVAWPWIELPFCFLRLCWLLA